MSEVVCADRVAIIPPTNNNRPGRKLNGGRPRKITIHETANRNRGANAEMHRRFVWQGGGEEGVSFHFVVDDTESIQLLPEDEVAWHAGDGRFGEGNSTSLSIELCVNADGDMAKARERLVVLVVRLLRKWGLSVRDVVQHNHWSGKDCPTILRHSGAWDTLISSIAAALAQPPVSTDEAVVPQTGKTVRGRIRALYERYGLFVTGYPISNEQPEGELIVQYFENVRIEEKPGDPNYPRFGAIGRMYVQKENIA